ncbi:MAG: hypothetical protein LBV51_05415, partial [Acholeplasmatales bacterium]|nr:hypothetical protein [Acholeplasmatales bacterium]
GLFNRNKITIALKDKCKTVVFLPKSSFCNFQLSKKKVVLKQEDIHCQAPEEGYFLDKYRITKCPILYNIDTINEFYGTNYINSDSHWLDVRNMPTLFSLKTIFKPNPLCAFHKNYITDHKSIEGEYSFIAN